jgi:hypothetical protein
VPITLLLALLASVCEYSLGCVYDDDDADGVVCDLVGKSSNTFSGFKSVCII